MRPLPLIDRKARLARITKHAEGWIGAHQRRRRRRLARSTKPGSMPTSRASSSPPLTIQKLTRWPKILKSRLLAASPTRRMVPRASRPAPSSDLVDRLLCYRVDPADRARLALARRRSRPLGSRSPSISSTDDTLSAGSRALMFSWLDKRPGQCGEHRTGPDPRQREFAMPKAVRNYARPRIPRLLNRRSRQRTN